MTKLSKLRGNAQTPDSSPTLAEKSGEEKPGLGGLGGLGGGLGGLGGDSVSGAATPQSWLDPDAIRAFRDKKDAYIEGVRGA